MNFLLIIISIFSLITTSVICIKNIYKCVDSIRIDDNQVRVSTTLNESSQTLGLWCPSNEITSQSHEYIQINYKSLHIITKIEVKHDHVDKYRIEYTRDLQEDSMKWIQYKDRDGTQLFSTSIVSFFNKPIIARLVRIIPLMGEETKRAQHVCLSIYVYGCEFEDDLVSYEIRNGDLKVNDQANYKDKTYDGKEVVINGKSYFEGGLGQLTDGDFGDTDEEAHKKERYGVRGYDWVGWRNHTDHQMVRIYFNFDNLRNFTMCSIYVFNNAETRIEQFSVARLRFSSDGGKTFNDELMYSRERDFTIGLPRPIFIDLTGKQGNTVLIEMSFNARWLLISEITFESKLAFNTPKHTLVSATMTHNNYLLTSNNQITQFTFQSLVILLIALLTILIVILVFIIVVLIRNKKRVNKTYKHKKRSTLCSALCCCCSSDTLTLKKDLYNECPTLKASTGTNSTTTTSTAINSCNVPLSQVDTISTYPTLKLNEFNFIPNPPSFLLANTLNQHRYMSNSGQSSTLTTPLLIPTTQAQQMHMHENEQAYLDHEYQLSEIHYAATEVNNTQSAGTTMLKLVPLKNTLNNNGSGGGGGNIYYTIKPQNHLISTNTLKSNHFLSSYNTIRNEKLKMLKKIDPQSICFLNKVGESNVSNFYVGQINLDCLQSSQSPTTIVENVLIKVLKNEHDKSIKCAFDNDIDLTIINKNDLNSNIIRLLGYCDNPYCFIIESYSSNINLYQYLLKQQQQQQSSEQQQCLSYANIIHIGYQITQAMLHLEFIQQIHKDLSTKNCLLYINKLTNEFHIKICDLARYMYAYRDDYCVLLTNTQQSIRLRYSAIEVILNGRFSHKSDVWSFGTLLYELCTSCLSRPFNELTDEQLIQFFNRPNIDSNLLIDYLVHSTHKEKLIETKELFDLMCSCWSINDTERPLFKDLNVFLSYQLSNGANKTQYEQQRQELQPNACL